MGDLINDIRRQENARHRRKWWSKRARKRATFTTVLIDLDRHRSIGMTDGGKNRGAIDLINCAGTHRR